MRLEDLVRQVFSLAPEIAITDEDGPGRVAGWDSLGHVNLMSSIEKTYGISIAMDEMMLLEKVSDIKKILQDKGVSSF